MLRVSSFQFVLFYHLTKHKQNGRVEVQMLKATMDKVYKKVSHVGHEG